MSAPVLFVAGLGRCGTTLVMTMLDAGGFPVAGPRPAYEPSEHWPGLKPDMDWLNAQGGRAVKWLDPTHAPTLPEDLDRTPVVLLLERDPRQQALSQIKLVAEPADLPARRLRSKWTRSIVRDMPVLAARLKRQAPLYRLRFEAILADPGKAAETLGRIVTAEFGRPFDVETSRQVVIPRSPRCAPHLRMEEMILPALTADMPPPATPSPHSGV